jgi:hypothetical protein
MRFPLVSRSVYEDAKEESRRKDAMIRYLISRLTAVKQEVKKAAPQPLPVQQPLIAPEVDFAVEQRAGGDPGLRRYLYKFAHDQTGKGMKPAEIAQRIRNGDGDDE